MYLVDEDDIESMVLDIFPPWNITMNSVNIDTHHDSINLNMIVSVNTNSELNILESFLDEEMRSKLESRIEVEYEWMNITDIHYNHIINPIRLHSEQNSNLADTNRMIPWLPFDNDTAIWMILGAIAVCACSTLLGVCALWYICKLRNRHKVRQYSRRSGIVVDHKDAKQRSHSSNSANSNSKSGDGYANEPNATYNSRGPHNKQRNSEVQLMMTDGTFVRRKGRNKKKHPIQYERIESNAEHLYDDDVALQHDHDTDEDCSSIYDTV